MVIVVLEHSHCGTTMITGILSILGVEIDGKNNYHMETKRIKEALVSDNEEKFSSIVKEMDSKYPIWGFKFPGAWRYPKLLKKYLKNPIYISIYKDPVSVTKRRYNKIVSTNRVDNTIRQMAMTINGMRYSRLHGIKYLSYTDAIKDPRKFVLQIADYIFTKPDEGTIKRAIDFIQPNYTDNPLKEYPCLT